MKKTTIFLLGLFFCVSLLQGQQDTIIVHETLGDIGFFEGPASDLHSLTSFMDFSDDTVRVQNWQQSSGYPLASGGSFMVQNPSEGRDTFLIRGFSTHGFSEVRFGFGVKYWSPPYNNMDSVAYSTDGATWTKLDKDALHAGSVWPAGGDWGMVVLAETLPVDQDEIFIWMAPTAEIFYDDFVFFGTPTSSNAYLKSFETDLGTFDKMFHKDSLAYVVTVPYGTTVTPTVSANAYHSNATVTVNDAADITSAVEADRTTTIDVLAEDNTTTMQYRVVFEITPPATDANLRDISAGIYSLSPMFYEEMTEYVLYLTDTASVMPEITVEKSDPNATVVITPAPDFLSTNEENRTTFIDVTAEDGLTTNQYKVVTVIPGLHDDYTIFLGQETFGEGDGFLQTVESQFTKYDHPEVFEIDTVEIFIRNLTPSTGYVNASGGNYVVMEGHFNWDGVTPKYDTMVLSNLYFTSYKNINLTFGLYNNTGWTGIRDHAISGSISTDGMSWNSLDKTTTATDTFPGSQVWGRVTLAQELPSSDTFHLIFNNPGENPHEFFMDDIGFYGIPQNTNNYLSDLSTDEGTLTPEFDIMTMNYNVVLPQGTKETPVVNAMALAGSSEVIVEDALDVRSLNEADRTTTVHVISESADTSHYTVVFDVIKSSNATLADLNVEGYSISPAFDSSMYSYVVRLDEEVMSPPAVSATPVIDLSTVEIMNAPDLSSDNPAQRTSTITVTAEDEINTQEYTVLFVYNPINTVRLDVFTENFGTNGFYVGEAEEYPDYSSLDPENLVPGDSVFIRNNDESSTGYDGASGEAFLLMQPDNDWAIMSDTFTVRGITTAYGLKNLKVSFGTRANTGWPGYRDHNFGIDISEDGENWTVINGPGVETMGTDTFPNNDWSWVTLAQDIPVTDSLILRFYNIALNHQWYMDDLTITGVPFNNDATLADITVSEGTLEPEFDSDTMDYVVMLPNGTNETPTVEVTPTDTLATVVIDDATDVTSENAADRTTTITVTAENGVTTQSYTVRFDVEASNEATLSDISLAEGTLEPEFGAFTFTYSAELPAGTMDAPQVTATPTDANASVVVNGATDVTSVNASDRTTTIVVTAEDGEAQLTYSIVFSVAATGINQTLITNLVVYPNPTSGKVRVAGEHINRIVVRNLIGQELLIIDDVLVITEVDVSSFANGTYLLHLIDTKGNVHIEKIQKK